MENHGVNVKDDMVIFVDKYDTLKPDNLNYPDDIPYRDTEVQVRALDASDGSVKWQYSAGGVVGFRIALAAAQDGSAIYFGTSDGIFTALDPSDGSVKWKVGPKMHGHGRPGSWSDIESTDPTEQKPLAYYGSVVGADGTIYAGSEAGVYAFNKDGTEKWGPVGVAPFEATPAIGADGTIYIGNRVDWETNSTFFAFNPDGTQKWAVTFPGNLNTFAQAHVGFSDGTIYVPGEFIGVSGEVSGVLSAFDQDGTLKWTNYFYLADDGQGVAQGADGSIYAGGSAKTDSLGVLLIGRPLIWNFDWLGLYAINHDDGTLKWKFDPEDLEMFVASVSFGSDGTIYAPNMNNYLYALSPDGTLKWRTDLQGDGRAQPAVSTVDGTIYLGTDSGVMYAIDPLSGSVKWSSTSAPKPENIGVQVLILYKKAE